MTDRYKDIDDWIKMAYPPYQGEEYPGRTVRRYAGWLDGYINKYGTEKSFPNRSSAFELYGGNMGHLEVRYEREWYIKPEAVVWLNEYVERHGYKRAQRFDTCQENYKYLKYLLGENNESMV